MAKQPAMPKADPATAASFRAALPNDARIAIRPMFGHTAAFVNGNMFAGTFGSDVFVRLPEAARSELLALEGARPFSPMKGRPMAEYVQLPPRRDAALAKAWFRRSLEWAATLPPKAKARKKLRR